jgi:hypothetical protein
MNEPKFTPGPWYAEKRTYQTNGYYIMGSDSEGNRLTDGHGAVVKIRRTETKNFEANAHLIAAAPTMYAALQECQKALAAAEAALAKARGEA